MKKLLVGIGIVVLALIVAVGVFFWYSMQQPLYQPGMVRAGQNLRAPLAPAPQPAAEQNFWLVEDDIKLRHFADGTGRNVLVIHGGPGYPFAGPLPALKPLTNKYRFVYYDQRGSGQSSRPIAKFTSSNYYENMTTLDKTLGLGAQIADIERIRRILGEEKLVLVGHSFGAFLAALYAAEFPERVEALILIAPADVLVMPAEDGGLYEEVKRVLPAELQKEYADYLTRYFDFGGIFSKSETELVALNAEFGKYYALAAQAKGFRVPPESEIKNNGGWMMQAIFFSMGQRHDYRAALKPVAAPVLVIHGANDLQPEKASRNYADAFPNARFQPIANAGHFVFDDQPSEFARVVGEFLK
ncbi:MAG: alpha/beta hydrolase [Chloroflexi bacterium]|nr:alpha/beta hydrolase [Chloroflexota bacterium]